MYQIKLLSIRNGLLILGTIAIISLVATWFTLTSPAQRTSGLATGTATVDVPALVSFSLTQNSINFSEIPQSGTDNTTDDSPSPFVLRNDGNVQIDIYIKANSFLFSGTGSGNNTNAFQFAAGNSTNETNTFGWANSLTDFTNFTDINQKVISALNYAQDNDLTEIEILINVPRTEPIGSKTADVIITAAES